MSKSFYDAFRAAIADTEIAKKSGLSYLSAATAMRLAGRPQVGFVDFDGKPQLDCLNGALVAVDLVLPGTEVSQRMWLPVMDQDNRAIEAGKMNLCDINNSRQRALVKAIAAVFGDGMSLYLACDGDGAKAEKLLNVDPDTDLAEVKPVVATLKEGGAPYIEWGIAVAACRITDPSFQWSVVMWEGKPYREVLGGIMVDVETVYRGKAQVLSLPIMDAAFNSIPAAKATVFDWNKTVMRALTKCIAFNTGYGLGVYADEFGTGSAKTEEGAKDDAKPRGGKKAKADAKAAEAAAPAAEAAAPVAEKVEAPAETAPVAEVAVEAVVEAGQPAEVAEAAAPVVDAAPVAEAAPAAEVAEAAAEAEAAAAVAKAAESAAAETPVAECVNRFKGVLQKRRAADGVPGIIRLFKDLHVSTKYTAEEKPICYGVLMPASAALSTEAEIGSLLAEVKAYNAMQYVPQDNRDVVAAKLVATALAAGLAESDEALVKAVGTLVEAGVAANNGEVLRLAKAGNVPAETLDLLVAAVE